MEINFILFLHFGNCTQNMEILHMCLACAALVTEHQLLHRVIVYVMHSFV